MMVRLWVTRPDEYSEGVRDLVIGMGYDAVCYGLLRYRLVGLEGSDRVNFGVNDGLMFTSAYGVRAFVELLGVVDLEVFCVGDSTASAALGYGFRRVLSAGGDVGDLVRLVADNFSGGDREGSVGREGRGGSKETGGILYHCSARETAGDLVGSLGLVGLPAERLILYESFAVEHLSSEICGLLVEGGISGIMLYSPKTARTLLSLVDGAGLRASLGGVVAFCLSSNVVAELEVSDWLGVDISVSPDESSLLSCIAMRFPRLSGMV